MGTERSHLDAILQHCAKLKALSIYACRQGTADVTVLALVPRVQELRRLRIHKCSFQSDNPLLALAPQCGNLRSLDLYSIGYSVDSAALVTLVSNLKSVVELCVGGWNVDDSVLVAIATHCVQLRVLHLAFSNGYTAIGVGALVRGCAVLKIVHVRANDRVITPLGRLLWKEMRPAVEFYHDDQCCAVWMQLENVEGAEIVVW
jgi:hypothetical protein